MGKFDAFAEAFRKRKDEEAKKAPAIVLQKSMVRAVDLLNIMAEDKKPAKISVRLNIAEDDLIYTERTKSRAVVVGYTDPKTGLFVTEVLDPTMDENEIPNVYKQFRDIAVSHAKNKVDGLLNELSQMNAEEYEKTGYKPLSRLRKELYAFLDDRNELYNELQKQVNIIESRRLPRVNEYLTYADDSINFKRMVTKRVPYNNPMNSRNTADQNKLVETFLDAFFDDYNKKVFAWYMGATLSNVDIHDDRISKMMVVASERGGSGKSTVVNGMVNALITPLYSSISPSFDRYFASNSRFATSGMTPKRMSVYSEADFADNSVVLDKNAKRHDFTGLDTSMIKSFITDGYIADEKKHKDEVIRKLHGLHIVLTNHPPVITDRTEALRRRILPLVVKPSRMQDKAEELGLWGQETFNNFLVENAQIFANYFVAVFNEDNYMFTDVEYNRDEFIEDIDESAEDIAEEEETKERFQIESVKSVAITDTLRAIAIKSKARPDRFVSDVEKTVLGHEGPETMRRDTHFLYIDSKKSAFLEYGKNALAMRNHLREIYGEPIKKFGRRMFAIRINQEFEDEVEDA